MPQLRRVQVSPVLIETDPLRRDERIAFGFKDTYLNSVRRNVAQVEYACRDVSLQIDDQTAPPPYDTYKACIERIIRSSYTLSRDWFRQLPKTAKGPCVQELSLQRVMFNLGHPLARDPGQDLDNPKGKDSQPMFMNSVLRDNACFNLLAIASNNKRLKVHLRNKFEINKILLNVYKFLFCFCSF